MEKVEKEWTLWNTLRYVMEKSYGKSYVRIQTSFPISHAPFNGYWPPLKETFYGTVKKELRETITRTFKMKCPFDYNYIYSYTPFNCARRRNTFLSVYK